MTHRKTKKTGPPAKGKSMSESSPNPHGESKVLEMPIRTDQRRETGRQNVAKNPSTVGGRLSPSVAHELRPMPTEAKNGPVPAERARTRKSADRDPFASSAKQQKRRAPGD